jgi:hypothetical protein
LILESKWSKKNKNKEELFCFNAADIHYGAHTNTFTYQIERKYKTKISKLCSLKLKDPLFGGY